MSRIGFLVVVLLLAGALLAAVVWVMQDLRAEITEPASGTVVGTEHEPPWTQIVCTPVGKVIVCNPIYHPECYRVDYVEGDDRGDACVSPVDFPRYTPGVRYP